MGNTSTDDTKNAENKYRKIPGFYSDLMGALLISYSTSPEQMRYIVACDLYGYVNASLIYSKKITKVDSTSKKEYSSLMESCLSDLNNAVMNFKTTDTFTGNEYLNRAMNVLKQIIMDNDMVSTNWSYVSNPLGTASVDQDRVQNTRYKEI